jgi:hypothetical protein
LTPITTEKNQLQEPTKETSTIEKQEDSDDQTFTLDFEL